MIFVYYDNPLDPKNVDIYLADSPSIKVRATFIDDGDVFVYMSDDVNCATYINRVIDPKKAPHMYFASNMEAIEDDEQFQTYSSYIYGNTNYQAQHKDERVDGEASGVWVPTYLADAVDDDDDTTQD